MNFYEVQVTSPLCMKCIVVPENLKIFTRGLIKDKAEKCLKCKTVERCVESYQVHLDSTSNGRFKEDFKSLPSGYKLKEIQRKY